MFSGKSLRNFKRDEFQLQTETVFRHPVGTGQTCANNRPQIKE